MKLITLIKTLLISQQVVSIDDPTILSDIQSYIKYDIIDRYIDTEYRENII